jgi:transposase-like protein
MAFRPPCCPHPACPSRSAALPFTWQRRGHFTRRCDGRRVQRFRCRACRRSFSTQTFRLDYRLQQPRLHLALFDELVSKVTLRQSARLRGASRKTIAHRLELLGRLGEQFHRHMLQGACRRGGLAGTFQLDELETYETDRRLQPVTVPVLIERKSYFVLHTAVAPLAARGGLQPRDRERKLAREKLFGKRRSGSRRVVGESFDVLQSVVAGRGPVVVQTDRKQSYASLLARRFGGRLWHERTSSREKRGYSNPLFPINHTLAMMRDGLSRLVRRTWAGAKRREKLGRHLWIWVLWRNYVRGITVGAPRTTPAMAAGVSERPWRKADLLRWRGEFLGALRIQ